MTKELTQGDGLSRPGIGGMGRPCITLPDTEEINEILAEMDWQVLRGSMRYASRAGSIERKCEMEAVPKIGETVYVKIDANRVKRRRIVEDEIILRGSAASLEKQIEAAAFRLQVARTEHDDCIDCGCAPCLTRAEELLTVVEVALDMEIALKALWKAATGKDY